MAPTPESTARAVKTRAREDFLWVKMECRDCHKVGRLPRVVLIRAKPPRCRFCGGGLDQVHCNTPAYDRRGPLKSRWSPNRRLECNPDERHMYSIGMEVKIVNANAIALGIPRRYGYLRWISRSLLEPGLEFKRGEVIAYLEMPEGIAARLGFKRVKQKASS